MRTEELKELDVTLGKVIELLGEFTEKLLNRRLEEIVRLRQAAKAGETSRAHAKEMMEAAQAEMEQFIIQSERFQAQVFKWMDEEISRSTPDKP